MLKAFLCLAMMLAGSADGLASQKEAEPNDVTAIDILLEPNTTMLQHAKENNARLRKVYPKGFALDAAHTPHITLVQRFVKTRDLGRVYSAANRVLAGTDLKAMKLEAFKYYYAPNGPVGVAGIVATPTPELLKLQDAIISAIQPFTVNTGDSSAFVTTPDDPVIDPLLVDYVSTFVPKQSGVHFNPHVSTGVAPKEYLDAMLSEPFESFVFAPVGAAVFQLGQFGTAARKLQDLVVQP